VNGKSSQVLVNVTYFLVVSSLIYTSAHTLTDIIRSRSLKIFVVFWPFFSVVPILKCTRSWRQFGGIFLITAIVANVYVV